jgi:hypothetical protein
MFSFATLLKTIFALLAALLASLGLWTNPTPEPETPGVEFPVFECYDTTTDQVAPPWGPSPDLPPCPVETHYDI